MLERMVISLLAGLVGLAVGSFLNLVIDRLPQGRSLLRPPSHCEHCLHPLRLLDLIPVASFILLRGRCRYCGEVLPWRLPVVEGFTGLLFGLMAWRFGTGWSFLSLVLILPALVILFFIDLEKGQLPDRVIFPALALALALFPFNPLLSEGQGVIPCSLFPIPCSLASVLIGGGTGFLALGTIYLVSRGRMGLGDVKLAALLGAFSGFPGILGALLVAFWIGGLVAVILLLLRKRDWGQAIPFGPFLVGGEILWIFWNSSVSV